MGLMTANGWREDLADNASNREAYGVSGSGGGGGGGSSSDQAAIRSFFAETAGFSREQLAEQKRQADQQIAWQREQMEKIGLPELAIKQRLADLEEQKFQEASQQFRATQGLDYLKFASTLTGPENVFNAADFARGASQIGDLPVFLQALSSNTPLRAFTGNGPGVPTPQTAESLAARLLGTAPAATATGLTPQQQSDAALARIGSIFQRGANQIGAQGLESLTESERQILQAGGNKLGYDVPAWLQQYQQSRVAQRAQQAL